MSGVEDLNKLLSGMSPKLVDGEYLFITVEGETKDYEYYNPIMSFREREGLTLIIPLSKATEHRLDYSDTYSMITLEIHSSLNAVGLTAAVSSKLAEDGISANVVAAFYHDHIFVNSKDRERALASLMDLVESRG